MAGLTPESSYNNHRPPLIESPRAPTARVGHQGGTASTLTASRDQQLPKPLQMPVAGAPSVLFLAKRLRRWPIIGGQQRASVLLQKLSLVIWSTCCQAYVLVEHGSYAAVQSQKAVSAYFASKQILPFGFAERYTCSMLLIVNHIQIGHRCKI